MTFDIVTSQIEKALCTGEDTEQNNVCTKDSAEEVRSVSPGSVMVALEKEISLLPRISRNQYH